VRLDSPLYNGIPEGGMKAARTAFCDTQDILRKGGLMEMAKLSTKKQNEMISKEIEKLEEIFADISEDKLKVARRLIERVAFMTITLQILEDDIKRKGPTYKFEQGKQKMVVENPSQKSYNTMINRYTAACKELFNLLPKEAQQEQDDGFDSFIGER
jgi:hypothetical protein